MRPVLEKFLLDLRVVCESIDEAGLGEMADRIGDAPRVFVAGVGRSGAMMRAFATQLAHDARSAWVVHDAGTPPIAEADLLVIGSGSGATRTMLAVADEARRRDAKIAVITSNALSPLGRAADHRLVVPPHLPVGTEPADALLAPMQMIFEQALLLTLDAISVQLGRRDPRHGDS